MPVSAVSGGARGLSFRYSGRRPHIARSPTPHGALTDNKSAPPRQWTCQPRHNRGNEGSLESYADQRAVGGNHTRRGSGRFFLIQRWLHPMPARSRRIASVDQGTFSWFGRCTTPCRTDIEEGHASTASGAADVRGAAPHTRTGDPSPWLTPVRAITQVSTDDRSPSAYR